MPDHRTAGKGLALPETAMCAMSTSDTFIKKPQVGKPFGFPDPSEREPGDMTSFDQISITGTSARTGRIVPHDDLFRMARTARFKGLNMEGGSG